MGFAEMAFIVTLANTATLATAFSIADSATNLERVGPGGMFAVSKRSLGNAFGGSIGIQLFLAQAVSIGFYCTGFAEPLQAYLVRIPQVAALVDQAGLSVLVQKQILATLVALVAFLAAVVGADFIVKLQMVIFAILSISVLVILISPFLGMTSPDGGAVFREEINLSGFGTRLGFWAAFAIFFPAVTGIDAGVGMSGVLKDPRRSLVKGTFAAIGVTYLVYMAITLVFAFVRRDIVIAGEGTISVLDLFAGSPVVTTILLVGILFATGSSALSYFMTAPRTAQALARDDILPGFLGFLGRDFRSGGNEPRWATLLTFVIVVPIIWAGDITFVSLIVGVCFLVVYGWVNLSAFLERASGNPSFRPTSRGHWLISLYGFVICMLVIALFNIYVGLGVIASQLLVFYLLLRYKSESRLEGVWWGLVFAILTWAFKRIHRIIQGTKNWRPIVGVFVFSDGGVETRETLRLARRLLEFKGLTMINILTPPDTPDDSSEVHQTRLVRERPQDFGRAIHAIVQATVPGGLQMNTVLLPVGGRLPLLDLVEDMIGFGKNVLLYKHGEPGGEKRIDVYWKGEENGNLMALLAYMIAESDAAQRAKDTIRIIRKLFPGENPLGAREELTALLTGARLKGEVLVLEEDDSPFLDTVRRRSADADLILMGMPGERKKGISRLFSLDRRFFGRQFESYQDLPPVLFVKAARTMSLLE